MSDERFQKTTKINIHPNRTAASKQSPAPALPSTRGRARMENSLDALAAPVFELVLQLRAGQVKPSNDLRRHVDEMVKHLEERGRELRYSDEQRKSVKFALAAFVDETMLTSDFPMRDIWEKNPLQLEYFGEHLAGVKFFERLEEMFKQPEENGEVIEIYYLCLLLGFKGQYNIYFEEQLKGIIKNTAEQLRRINRLTDNELSPHWKAADQPEPPSDSSLPLWAKMGGGVGVTLVVLIFLVLYVLLRSDVTSAKQQLLR
jgi:type VI secretion system protein ImpK